MIKENDTILIDPFDPGIVLGAKLEGATINKFVISWVNGIHAKMGVLEASEQLAKEYSRKIDFNDPETVEVLAALYTSKPNNP